MCPDDMAAVAYLQRMLSLNLNFNCLILVVWSWAHYLPCLVFIFLICNTKAKLFNGLPGAIVRIWDYKELD